MFSQIFCTVARILKTPDMRLAGNRAHPAHHQHRFFKSLHVLLVTSLVLAGCGADSDSSSASGGNPVTGTAGSTARMVIDGDYLYAIAGSNVQLFDISDPAVPNPWTQVGIAWTIQTLFPYKNYLLVGAADGIHILDNSDPASPRYVGDFQHAVAEDPVVAQDDVAYVTLRRDETQAPTGIVNQLNIIDISDVTNPTLVQTQFMQGPKGLSVQADRLYVCDGEAGLKSFDLTDKLAPVFVQSLVNVNCNDVIAVDNLLYVIDEQGFSQYDTSLSVRPQLLSTLEREPVIYQVDR